MTGDPLSPDDRWRKGLTAIVALTIASVVIGLMAVAYVIWLVGRQSGPAGRRPQSSSADGLVDAIASPAWQARPGREPWSLPPYPSALYSGSNSGALLESV